MKYGYTDWITVYPNVTDLTWQAGIKEAPTDAYLRFTDAAFKGVSELSVGRWENAFEKPNIRLGVKANFIDLDPDRFWLFAKNSAKNLDPTKIDYFTVKISTTSDTGNEVLMKEDGINTGRFWSSYALLLTSVKADDDYEHGELPDNTNATTNPLKNGDATFLVKLGDKVTATVDTLTAEATVPVKHIVKLKINIIRDKKAADGGEAPTTVEVVQAEVNRATSYYAPVGIKFDADIQIVDPPANVDLSNGLDVIANNYIREGKIVVTAEEKNLLTSPELRTATKSDIEIFIISKYEAGKKRNAQAYSFSAKACADEGYADSIIAVWDQVLTDGRVDKFVLPHELAHILMNSTTHVDARAVKLNITNIMASPYSDPEPADGFNEGSKVYGSRRFYTDDTKAIATARPNLLGRP